MAEAVQTRLTPRIGLSDDAVQGVVGILKTLLADEMVLYTRLRNYHWNVTGLQFQPLHDLFEEQYDELAEVIDDTAERIRQYGAMAPGTLEEFKALTRLSEQPGVYPDARTMIANLLDDHETMIRHLRADCDTIDDEYDDIASEDYLTGLLQQHQKMAWKLRAHLEGA
jgi:starvation-inducible DNA-binding protein